MYKEEYDLEKLKTIGGTTYNHTGQIIRTPHHGADGGWLFMGDDYEEYSALDCLIKNIVEHPRNFDLDIRDVEYITDITQHDDLDFIEVQYTDWDGEAHTKEIYYEYLSISVIVNYNTKFTVTKRSA